MLLFVINNEDELSEVTHAMRVMLEHVLLEIALLNCNLLNKPVFDLPDLTMYNSLPKDMLK